MKPTLTYRAGQIALITSEIAALIRQYASESPAPYSFIDGDETSDGYDTLTVEVQIDCAGGESIYADVTLTEICEMESAATRTSPAQWSDRTICEISNVEVHDENDEFIQSVFEDPADAVVEEFYFECA